MEGLITRMAALEDKVTSSTGVAKDFRVIEMHLARAEEKIMRYGRSSCTGADLMMFVTEERS